MKALLFALVALLSLASHAEAQVTKVNLLMAPAAVPPSYSGPGDIIGYTSWVSTARAYTAAIAGTQKLVNITSTSHSDTCDVLTASNGGTGVTANCGVGGNNGLSGTTFCTSATDCVIVTLYQQVTGGSLNPGNYASGGTEYWNPTGLNGLACMTIPGGDFVQASNKNNTGVVSLSVVAKELASSTSGSTDTLMSQYNITNNQLVFFNTTITMTGNGTGGMAQTVSMPGSHAANGVINGASSSLNVDGTLASVVTTPGQTGGNNPYIGYNGGSDTTCIGEAGYIDGVDFATSEAALHTNQAGFWGTP